MVSQRLFLRTRFLVPLSDHIGRNKRIEDGYILTENSKILEVGEFSPEVGRRIIKQYNSSLTILGNSNVKSPSVDDMKIINGVALPGFVKAHGHDHESPLIGITKDVPLTVWLDEAVNYFTGFLNEKFDDLKEEFGKSPYLITYLKAKLDDIQYGITSCMTHHCNFNKYHVDDLVEAVKIAGTKIIIAVGSQDRNYDSRILDSPPRMAIERLDRYYEQYKNIKNIRIIPGPDQFFSNGPELLKALKEWATDHKTLIHIHSSEEPGTTKWFKEEYGMTPVEYGESIGFLDENTILAHQVQTTENDLEILAKTGTKIVHNPLANTILGSGMPPILKMLNKDIPVVISTDGSGSADNQNIINAARVASQYQKAYHTNAKVLPAQKILEMITVDSANMLRLNTGSLEPNKDADIVVVDLDLPNMIPTRRDTVIENLIWAANGNEISYVVANGKVLMYNYNFITLDKREICQNVQLLAEKFEKYMEQARPRKETGIQRES